MVLQYLAQALRRKPSRRQEAKLACVFFGIGRRLAEFFLPCFGGTLDFGALQLLADIGQLLVGQAMLTKLLKHQRGAPAAGAAIYKALGKTLVGKPIIALEFVKHRLQLGWVFGVDMRSQLARKFDPGVLTPRQYSHGPGL